MLSETELRRAASAAGLGGMLCIVVVCVGIATLHGAAMRTFSCRARLKCSAVDPDLVHGPMAARGAAPPVRTAGRLGYSAVLIVPTGIGAAIGGYAGDALPVARTLASVVDTLVTHPNVMNGAMLYAPPANALYVEGHALDAFAARRLALQPVRANRIGLLLDSAIEPELKLRHLQAADAARATLGLDVSAWAETDMPLGIELEMSATGASWGSLRAPDALVRGARRLVDEAGCTAVAIVGRFPDDEDEALLEKYRHGSGVDAVGGAEALISHLVSAQVGVPCAHAPALSPLEADPEVDPRAAAEELGYTFLPCVLANLHRAPALVPMAEGAARPAGPVLAAEDVDVVVAPASACGGGAVMSLAARGHALVIAVDENDSVMRATPEVLRLPTNPFCARTVHVRSYLEAVGVIAAHRAGVNPSTLTRAGVGRVPKVE